MNSPLQVTRRHKASAGSQVDHAEQADAVTVEVDPRYAARHQTTRPANDPPASTEAPAADGDVDRWERTARNIGDYWGRALVDAWRTVFPPREDSK